MPAGMFCYFMLAEIVCHRIAAGIFCHYMPSGILLFDSHSTVLSLYVCWDIYLSLCVPMGYPLFYMFSGIFCHGSL